MTPAAISEAVELLIAARGDHRRLDAFPPSCRPASLDDAYAIQEAFAAVWGAPVAGYKIGCTSAEAQALLGAPGPFPGRVFAPVLLRSPAHASAKAHAGRGQARRRREAGAHAHGDRQHLHEGRRLVEAAR